MDNRTLVVGAFGLAVGLLLGMLIAPSGPDIAEVRTAVGEELAKAGEKTAALEQNLAGMTDQMTSLSQGIGGIEASVKDLSAKLGTDAEGAAGGVADLTSKLEAMASSLSSKMSEAAESQTAALRQGLAALTTRGAAAPAESKAAAPATAAPAAAPAAAASGEPQGLSAGRTASFGDGSLRVTVSRVDEAAGSARLSVNGKTVTMGAGETMMAAGCKLQLDGVDRGHAAVSALCGGELPEPAGIAPGAATVLGDGAARVFLSAVSADGSAARIAVNGFTLETVPAGGSAKVEGTDCAVVVSAIDRGHVSFDYSCGG